MSEPQRQTRFPNLRPLQERLANIHGRSPHEEGVEVALVHLVEALEEAAYQTEFHQFLAENNDSTQDLANLARLGKHLEAVSQSLQTALQERNSYFRW